MKCVFLTGATGAIGSALVPQLLAEPATQVRALIRAPDAAALARRRLDLLAHCGIDPASDTAARLQVMAGDITRPDLGLAAADRDAVTAQATHLLHCAASVKLNMSPQQAHDTAVAPTRTLLALARQARARGVLRKVDLVSTVGVWGREPGTMPETPLPQVQQFHNSYEAAKSEAERLVWDEGAGLPLTVHRPSMVVGDRRDGRIIHFQVFYHLCEFLSGTRTLGVMPDLGSTRLDTVPVDWVAQVLCWAGNRDDLDGRILHLCAGPDLAMPLPQLQQRVRQIWQAHGRRVPRLWRVSRRMLAAGVPVLGLLLGARTRRALKGLNPVLAYLDEDQSFSNRQTQALLAPHGLAVPAADGYLDAVLGHYLAATAARRQAGQR